MKHYLRNSIRAAATILAIAGCTAPVMGFHPVETNVIREGDRFVEMNPTVTNSIKGTPLKAGIESHTLTVRVNIENKDAEPAQVVAARVVDGAVEWYRAEEGATGFYLITVPDGEYDIMAYFWVDSMKGGAMLTSSEPVVVNGEDVTYRININDATIRTDIQGITPDGTPLTPLDKATNEGNVIRSSTNTFGVYRGNTLVMYDIFRDTKYFLTNNETSPFSVVCVSTMCCTDDTGIVVSVFPIDFSNPVTTQTLSNWQTANVDFQLTPFNVKAQEVYPQIYTMSMVSFIAEGQWWFSSGDGVLDYECNSGNIKLWIPENYDRFVDVVAYPTGATFHGGESQIRGIALRHGENGLQQVGHNLVFGRDLFTNPEYHNLIDPGNALLSFDPNGMKFGNCAPTLINFQYTWTGFNFGFTGRHGEIMTIDCFDLLDSVNPDFVSQYGGNTCSLLIQCNGQTICNDITDFDPEDGGPEGDYHVEISTENVSVDGLVPGYNHTVFEYNTEEIGGAPTISVLQFRNTDDRITDRFSTASDGRLIMYATQYTADLYEGEDTEYMWYRSLGPQSVKVEVAPYGTEDYVEINVDTDSSKDYGIEWGQYFEGSLESISTMSPNGWFNVKITVYGTNDSWEEQVIAPAFKIENLNAGVQNINYDTDKVKFHIEGRNIVAPGARIFDMNGIETDGSNLTPGVYLISAKGKTVKAIVK